MIQFFLDYIYMDLVLLNTIINIIWYIFSIIFVLYKFTTFFSYVYNILRFCGKLFTCIIYIKDKIIKKRECYTEIDCEYVETFQKKSFLKRAKEYIYSFFNKKEKKIVYTTLPDTPLRTDSSIIYNQIQDLCLNDISSNILDRQYCNMEESSINTFVTCENQNSTHIPNPLTNDNYLNPYLYNNYGSIINHETENKIYKHGSIINHETENRLYHSSI